MPSREQAEVVIIGAGAAGLSAARTLAGSGKRVIIVEARERIGGRIYTHHAPLARSGAPASVSRGTVPVELGAEFIHGLPAASWSLVREAQLQTIERQGEHFCFDGRLLELCGEAQRDSFKVLEGMEAWLERCPPGSDFSFENYIEASGTPSAGADRAAAYVEGFNAADRNIVSATALMRQQRAEDRIQGDRIFHIRPGYAALTDYIADGLSRSGATILLNSPVAVVRWRNGSVRLEGRTAGGRDFCIEAPQAIVTLPLGVLQANHVTFDPVPAEMQRQWHSLAMGQAHRVTLVFERRFWNERAPGLSFLFAPGEIIPTWWTTMPEAVPMITGWAAGAGTMDKWQQAGLADSGATAAAALRTLAKIFGVAARELEGILVSAHHHDWERDEFSAGAYSYVRAGGLDACRILSTPLQATLFFAGEHTDVQDQWGTVHAALTSGMRAAEQVLERRPRRP